MERLVIHLLAQLQVHQAVLCYLKLDGIITFLSSKSQCSQAIPSQQQNHLCTRNILAFNPCPKDQAHPHRRPSDTVGLFSQPPHLQTRRQSIYVLETSTFIIRLLTALYSSDSRSRGIARWSEKYLQLRRYSALNILALWLTVWISI